MTQRARRSPRLSTPLDQLEASYDAVVVGSGYGAAVAACRLARTGRSVCVLERGLERWPGEYPDSLWSARRQLQANTPAGHIGNRHGMFEFHVNDDLNALVGCGLGGTSLINANVVEPAEDRVFLDATAWPAVFRTADGSRLLAPWEAEAERMLRPTSYPDSAPALDKLDALEAAAGAMGRGDAFRRPRIAVTFETHDSDVGIRQHPCTGCGDCVTGCNHWAKNTTLMNYLPDAVAHGARIFCEVEVERVSRTVDGRWSVHVQVGDAHARRFGRETPTIDAEVVVLGAGALGSTGILLRSRAAGLPVSAAVGSRFSGNADVLAFGYDADVPVHGFVRRGGPPPIVGPCIAGIVDERRATDLDDGLVIEEGSVPGAIARATAALLASVSPLAPGSRWWHPRRAARRLASIVRGVAHGAAARSQVYLVMGHDGSDGRLSLRDDGRVRIDWPSLGTKPIFDVIDDELEAGDRGIGAQHLRNPLWSKWFGEDLVTVHPLGGCPMGDDPATSVVDDTGRAWSADPGETHLDGLYVMDGAVVPRSVGINPLLTITAIAERSAQTLITERGWRDSEVPAAPLPEATPRGASIRFTERMTGTYRSSSGNESPMSFVVTALTPPVANFVHDPLHTAELIGTCTCPALADQAMTIIDGRFHLFVADPQRPDAVQMRYRFTLDAANGPLRFSGTKVIPVRSFTHLWHDTTTLAVEVTTLDGTADGSAVLEVRARDLITQLTTMRVEDGASTPERVRAGRRFVSFFGRTLLQHYGGVLSTPSRPPVGRPSAPSSWRVPDEVEDVVTPDGALIRLTRHRGGNLGPVLLVHGAAVSSAIFTTTLTEVPLARHLFERGHDVWLLDTRFSTAMPGATAASDGDVVAANDHPAAVAHVLGRTGADSLQAVVHCWGANTFLMSLLAGLDGVSSVVVSQVGTHLLTPELTTLKTALRAPTLMRRARVRWLDAAADARPTMRARMVDRALRLYPVPTGEGCRSATCRRCTALYGLLWQHDHVSPLLHDHLDEMVGPASVPVFEHLAAMVRAGHLVDAAGDDVYLDEVERLLDKPILLLHGERNQCYSPESTERMHEWLVRAGHRSVTRVTFPERGHLDCIFGRDAHLDVFPVIADHLEQV